MNKLAEAMRLGSPFIIKPTKKQNGGFLSILPASVVVPLLLKALTGNGIQGYSRYEPQPPHPPPKSDGSDM